LEVAEAASQGARVLASGGLVGFATETVYGIAALATDQKAMERLRELKSRPDRPFSVHLGSGADARLYVKDISPAAARMMRRGWPGPLTLVLPLGGKLADAALQRAKLYDELSDHDMIGLRCPDEPVAAAMLSAVKGPVVAPSANLAGKPSPRRADDVLDAFADRLDLLIDSGPTRYGKDSTIVSMTPQADYADGWSIVRKGVLDERAIRQLLRQRILFVCSGNTCRSPLAAGLARRLLADRVGGVGELRKHGLEVGSAGLYAMSGAKASPEAVAAADRYGADISRHRSRPLTAELIDEADLVLCMTEMHVVEARRLAPLSADKICRLDSRGDIPDPIGGGPGVYMKTAERLERVLKTLTEEGIL
jgi:protein-tyrosine phosphatase